MQIGFSSNYHAVAARMFLDAKQMQDAQRIALNKMAEQSKVAASRLVRSAGYKLKAAVVKDAIKIERATNGKLKATLIATGRPIPLLEFSATWGGRKSKGVNVSVKTGRKMVAGAFIAEMPNGKRVVAVRADNAKHKKVKGRNGPAWHALPIRQLYGPSVADMMKSDAIQKALLALYEEKFPKHLTHEYKRLTSKAVRDENKRLYGFSMG
jgi:hypothetical protein